MSHSFIDRSSNYFTQNYENEETQKKIDPIAQLKEINNTTVREWGPFNNPPAQMFAKEEEKETIQGKGLAVNNNSMLEKEADVMGARAAQGIMTNVAGSGSGVQRKTSTFIVPKGWGLAKIASHLDVDVQELKELNKDKLKTWGEIQGFNVGEVILYSVKSDKKEDIKVDPKTVIEQAYKDYENGSIGMPDLARALLPYVSSHANNIGVIFYKLDWNEKDNLSYALTFNSPNDSDLEKFDKNLLKAMSTFLDTYMTWRRGDNQVQKKRIDNILNKKITNQAQGLKNIIGNKKGEEEKIRQVINYVRKQFEDYPPKVKAFKNQSKYNDDEKLRILGEIAALTARLEVLMGAIFYKGTAKANTWETKGSNKGDDEFLKYYQTEKHGVKNQGSEWCAMFVASVLSEVLGFAPVDEDGKRRAQSGYGWLTWNVTSLHDSVKYHAKNSKYDTRHSKKITNEQFLVLRKKIVSEIDQEKKYKKVKKFFENHFKPQPGDLLAVGAKKSESLGSSTKGKAGFKHSTMIEKYIDDSKNHRIYIATVEGNANQRAGGRLIDLTKCTNSSSNDLSFITQISRVSLSNYGIGISINDGTKDAELKTNSSKLWSDKDLIDPLQQMANILQDYTQNKGYIKKGDHSTSISELVENDARGSIN